jgi:uncharacterized repeat protein (TIGR01451 family)
LPDSVSFVNASLSPSFFDQDSVAWQLASLNAGSEDSINVTVKLAANVPLALDLLLSEAKLFFSNDTTPGNNAAFDTVRVVRPAQPPPPNTDLAIAMTSFTDTSIVVNGQLVRATKPGSEYEYRLKVRNFGPRAASNIRVRQLLPDSVSFVNASLSPSFFDKDSVAWQLASLNVGSEDSINVTVKLAANLPLALDLLLSEARLFFANDTTPSNNAAFDTVRVVRPAQPPPPPNTDLAIAMTSFTDTSIVVNGKLVAATKPGSEYEYRLKVRNHGPRAASNIRVRQLLPDSVSFVNASLSPSFFDQDSVAWQLASLNAGSEDSINVTVKLAANVPLALELLSSEAKLFFANDTTPANNAAFDTVRVVRPGQPPPPLNTDLAMSMASFTDTSIVVNGKLVRATKPGSEYEYRLKVRNRGPRAASNIRVRQLLPDSVSFVNASLSPSFFDQDSVAWLLASLNSGSEDSINVTVKLAANLPLTLELLSSEAKLFLANDTTPANNAAFDTVRVVRPAQPPPPPNTDLAIAMTSFTDTSIVVNGKLVRATKPGSEFEYRLKVRNRGPRNASNIRVRQLLPDSVSFVNASLSPSFFDKDSVAWQLASLNVGNEDSINVAVKLAANLPLALDLLLSEARLFFANDTTPTNNAAFDTVRVVRPAPPLLASIVVTQRAQTDSFAVARNDTIRYARAGETYRYTLTVSNTSGNEARNVRLTDFLPDSISASGFQPAPVFANRDSARWALGDLAPRSSRTLIFNATVSAFMPVGTNLLINKIAATADNLDPALSRLTASDTVRNIVKPLPPLLTPRIEASPPVVNVGEKVFVRVQVLDAIDSWDLRVHFANGDIDSSFAEAFIAANPRLTPNVWHDVEPSFNNARLVTAAKQEELRFEIRTRDRLQRFASASASVRVQSGNDMALDRNVYEPERESGLNVNFKLSSNRKARLEVYDLAGHYVTKLAEGEYNAGWNTHVWNGVIAENGCVVGSGVYLVLLRAGEYEDWKKVIIVR